MRRRLCIVLCALAPAWALTLALASAAPAAQDTFFVADGLQGESANNQFPNAMDVFEWSWGVSNAESKVPTFQVFSLKKPVDRSSPKLLEHAAAGTVIPNAKLHVVRVGGDQQEFLRYCFAGVRITSVSTSGGGDQLEETISFSYEFIIERYARQKPDGTLEPPVFGGWNVLKNLVLPPGNC